MTTHVPALLADEGNPTPLRHRDQGRLDHGHGPLVQQPGGRARGDVAYELSTRRREADDYPGALWAARQGLIAAEENEMLHRCLFLAHHAAGDIDALREAAATLTRINEQLGGGVDMEAETAELLRNLLPRPVAPTRS